jgi:hypothetical protein
MSASSRGKRNGKSWRTWTPLPHLRVALPGQAQALRICVVLTGILIELFPKLAVGDYLHACQKLFITFKYGLQADRGLKNRQYMPSQTLRRGHSLADREEDQPPCHAHQDASTILLRRSPPSS